MGNYYACWSDGVRRSVVDTGDGAMEEWAEAKEVCLILEAEEYGDRYYVGDKDARPLNPTVEEAERLLDYLIERGYISPADYHLLDYFIDRVADFERGRRAMKQWFDENPEFRLLDFDEDEDD